MKKRLSILYLFFLVISYTSFSQSSIVVAGGDGVSSSASFSFTVGQIAYIGSENVIPGIQLPTVGIPLVFSINDPLVHVKMYPNPSKGEFFIEMDQENQFDNWTYEIIDQLGRYIQKKKIVEKNTKVQLKSYQKGHFIVIISQMNKRKRAIEIVVL